MLSLFNPFRMAYSQIRLLKIKHLRRSVLYDRKIRINVCFILLFVKNCHILTEGEITFQEDFERDQMSRNSTIV